MLASAIALLQKHSISGNNVGNWDDEKRSQRKFEAILHKESVLERLTAPLSLFIKLKSRRVYSAEKKCSSFEEKKEREKKKIQKF